jgi:hypothetical protein
MSGEDDIDWTDRIQAFLQSIGLTVRERPLSDETFLPGLAVAEGGIDVDRGRLRWPGDLLHEAGHLAVMPAALRAGLNGDLHDSHEVAHAGEIEAMAWAYAACVAIEMPPPLLFHAGGYRGAGEPLQLTYSMGVYPGLQGLSACGMALTRAQADARGEPAYPRMQRWLRD